MWEYLIVPKYIKFLLSKLIKINFKHFYLALEIRRCNKQQNKTSERIKRPKKNVCKYTKVYRNHRNYSRKTNEKLTKIKNKYIFQFKNKY